MPNWRRRPKRLWNAGSNRGPRWNFCASWINRWTVRSNSAALPTTRWCRSGSMPSHLLPPLRPHRPKHLLRTAQSPPPTTQTLLKNKRTPAAAATVANRGVACHRRLVSAISGSGRTIRIHQLTHPSHWQTYICLSNPTIWNQWCPTSNYTVSFRRLPYRVHKSFWRDLFAEVIDAINWHNTPHNSFFLRSV